MRKKQSLLLVGAILMGGFSLLLTTMASPCPDVNAQTTPLPTDRVEKRLDGLTRHLKLTDDQRARIRSTLMDEAHQLEALRQDRSVPRADRMNRRDQIRQSTQGQIRQVLRPEQQAKFDRMQQKQKANQQSYPNRQQKPWPE
jgi:Spy/CpxP family protein refolding chaperone